MLVLRVLFFAFISLGIFFSVPGEGDVFPLHKSWDIFLPGIWKQLSDRLHKSWDIFLWHGAGTVEDVIVR